MKLSWWCGVSFNLSFFWFSKLETIPFQELKLKILKCICCQKCFQGTWLIWEIAKSKFMQVFRNLVFCYISLNCATLLVTFSSLESKKFSFLEPQMLILLIHLELTISLFLLFGILSFSFPEHGWLKFSEEAATWGFL